MWIACVIFYFDQIRCLNDRIRRDVWKFGHLNLLFGHLNVLFGHLNILFGHLNVLFGHLNVLYGQNKVPNQFFEIPIFEINFEITVLLKFSKLSCCRNPRHEIPVFEWRNTLIRNCRPSPKYYKLVLKTTLRAVHKVSTGQIWPADRTLPTPDVTR